MKQEPKILLVEDEITLGLIIKDSLETRGFKVIHVTDGNLAYAAYTNEKPNLIVLDVMLPAVNGFTVAEKIRLENKHTPILFLTARTMPHDVLNGYMAGGNDYLKKPFDMEELIVRIKVLLNQNRLLENEQSDKNSGVVDIGKYTYDMMRGFLVYQSVTKQLTGRESEVLKILFQNRNRLLARKEFLLQVWGDDDFFSSRSLDVFITKLRRHFKHDPAIQIINHRGFGYKLIC
ncbi:response regulator transcription factor [Pedobacter frigoris]|uniref:Response regulator transcription factor n=1 Tax=Pedobacter frigoris TaxID=2571272 RepID=A0A4U1CT25_9SPHI|nr:response regulator transcription factor [Pedobacter frigoris]TKC08888.1 response regulator transcription factor [Pedobacter frigoris]